MNSAPGNLVTVGKITTVFGIRGWIKIHSYTQPIDNLLNYQTCYARRKGQWEKIIFDQGRVHGKGLVAHIKGCDDREIAHSYVQTELAISQDELPALEDGDYYWHQLEGLQVWARLDAGSQADTAVLLGSVDHLLETGSNDVLVVSPSAESVDQRERLIPYRPGDVVTSVDLDGGRMDVVWDTEF